MTVDALWITEAVIVAIMLVGAAFSVPTLLRLSNTALTMLLRASTVCVIVLMIALLPWSYPYVEQDPVRETALTVVIDFSVSFAIAFFWLAELEFLKLFGPLIGLVSRRLVTRVQIVVAFGNVLLVVAPIKDLHVPVIDRVGETYAFIWAILFCIYDLCQQSLNIYLLLSFLKDTPLMFRIKYAMVMAAGLVVFVVGIYFESTVGIAPSPQRGFSYLTVCAFILLSTNAILVLRSVVAERQRSTRMAVDSDSAGKVTTAA
ncbi:hypothetical protein HK105_208080 [Polyrhizophydium stewartii]|uniref:Uncharacterized protein n=1 Tax=Polyrhizophydium stewartii TaxID=2732419 RepID=A0ABR4MZ23_9FUNG|nr:hypothetical protein HK105_004527 [Polyrhizophydium stewartii]